MNSIYAALGFSMKAGKACSGDYSVEKAMQGGKAKMIIIDDEASDATKKRWQQAAANKTVPSIILKDAGHAIGKDGRMVIAITDGMFTEMILKLYNGCSAESE